MASRIRVLDSAKRTMQRLGFLKVLAALVNESETSNLETLGKRFVARVTQRVKLTPPYDDDLKHYARTRLTDGAYRELRKRIMEDAGPPASSFRTFISPTNRCLRPRESWSSRTGIVTRTSPRPWRL